MTTHFYVYLLIDPTTKQPFYVGKGSGRRMYEHFRTKHTLRNKLLKNKILSLHKRKLKITYEKVLVNVTEQDAFAKETELIQLYGRKIDATGILCNLSSGGEGNSTSWTEERKAEVKCRMKGKKGNLPTICKPVSQYTLAGEYITDFESAKIAGHQTGANISYITQCCKQKRKSAGGFMWVYKGSPAPTQYHKQYYRQVSQFDLHGKHLATYQSLTHAQNQTGIERHCISECCRGKSKTSGGFKWKYAT